ncbi:4-(cytidine 5'-diphospho)-2-C-methyl-D-erythritol kinase [Phenylobacterium immobile]|uniref:4-(cytidine 5'-diphospho)-2-C-methyl-D-erythritol kinase n=1 Tax=Phenylobacterium immobile TaxID=21 RepID=UPI000A9309E5|nr:4-(cytidine 5'-diphospho)-2-C-methyl-D-erythritol kinase [Phenylobacterium immobile]
MATAGRTLAPAKVNLFLHVGPPQADGYHSLCSLMAFADTGDELRLEPAAAFELAIKGPFGKGLAADPSNLVWRAAEALAREAGVGLPPVRLILDKRLPVASGLGGGSSDAGAALRLVRASLDQSVDDARLEALAAGLGADGAPCLWGRPTLAQGRGERLSAVPELPPLWAVLANCGVSVSTPAVYRALDQAAVFGAVEPPTLPTWASAADLAAWLGAQRNDLERPSLTLAGEIGPVLAALSGPEALLTRLSGSGGTCFALCGTAQAAASLAARVLEDHPDWWVRDCRLGGPWT